MKKLILLLIIVNLNGYCGQSMMYFDRDMIVEHHIKKIYEMISYNVKTNVQKIRSKDMFNFEEQDIGTPWRACRNDYYLFDERGNIIFKKSLVNEVRYIYEYNQKNEMINYYQSGFYPFENLVKMMDFKEYLGENKELFNTILANYQEALDKFIVSRVSYRKKNRYDIVDSCSGIRARYEMSIVEEKDGLPILLKGHFIKYLPYEQKFGLIPLGYRDQDSKQSPQIDDSYKDDIYIYYDYFFKDK